MTFPALQRIALVGLLAGLGASAVNATESWPTKPVTIVVSFVPGGATDLVGRILAEGLGKRLGQPVVVANRPGAGGQVGTEYVATQPADGYTLLISATGHVMAPTLQRNVQYEPVGSFAPISLLITMPNLLVVNPALPPQDLTQFLAWGKQQSGIPYGSAGTGGATHLSGEMFRHRTGLAMSHVPYKGNGPSMVDVMAGHIPAAFVDTASVGDLVHTGKVRAVAVTSAQRSKLYPDVATVAESGYPGYDLQNWVGLYAPAGTPPAIVTRLNQEVNAIMGAPETVARLEKLGADSTNGLDAAQFRQFVLDEVGKWRETVKVTGVTVEN